MRDLLSPREKRFLRRLAAGKTDAQIARSSSAEPWSKSQSRDPGCLRDCRSIRPTRSLMQPSDWRTGPAIEASRKNATNSDLDRRGQIAVHLYPGFVDRF